MMPVIESVTIDVITIGSSRRAIDGATVDALAASMEKIGLKTPITIRSNDDTMAILVAGAHRLEAAKRLGWDKIDCFVLNCTEDEAEMWEISENLHRAELTVLQRSEQIARWAGLAEKVYQVGTPGGRQPKEGGVRKAARELNITPNDVSRSKKVASLTEKAKEAARQRGLDDNQSALIAAAAVSPEMQEQAIHSFADAKADAAAARANVPPVKDWTDMEAKQKRSLMTAWNAASPLVKEWFRDQIDVPVMDARFG